MDRWQVLFFPISNVDIHNPQCPWPTISLSTIFTIQSVCPQFPYPRYPQVCDHDPQYLYPQYPQSTMSMTHNILINDIYDPRCHCPWSTMSFIILWTTFLNRYPHQQPQLKRTNQSKDAWDRRGKWFIIIYCCWSLMGRSLLLVVEQGKLRWSGRAWSAGQAQSSQFCLESPDR